MNEQATGTLSAISNTTDETLGGRIARARIAVGLSTAQLARRLGVKTITLQQWETDRSEPRSNRLATLAGMLGVTPGWLLIGHGEAPADVNAQTDLRLLQQELISIRLAHQDTADRLDRAIDRVGRLLDSAASDADAA